MYRKILIITALIFLLSTGICMAASAPNNVSLPSSDITTDSITVTWTAGNTGDQGYYVYWGTSSSSLDQKSTLLSISTTQYQITGLNPGTTYYVAVHEIDYYGGDVASSTVNATTQTSTTKPTTPTGFSVTSLSSVTETQVGLQWNANSDTNVTIDHYNIYYGTTSGSYGSPTSVSGTSTSTTITGLTSATRYYFAITAVSTASTNNESDKSSELLVDTLPDSLPPFVPKSISAKMSGVQQITVSINNSNNSGMADFAGLKLYYGTTSGSYDHTVDLKKGTTYVLNDLPEGSTWYFAAAAYDATRSDGSGGNLSAKTKETSATIEDTTTFTKQSDHFSGGCFIGTASASRPDPVRMKNKVGIAGAYLMPTEKSFHKFYGRDLFPVFLFYERELFSNISVELTSGYMKQDGHLLTVSGEKTQIASHYTLVPVSASMNYNIPITPYIWGFVGAGPDYWYCREKTSVANAGSTSDWVGGYHANVGFWLYNEDPEYKHWGVLIEGNYSRIDRFGSNDIDIGGWLVKFGIFYQF